MKRIVAVLLLAALGGAGCLHLPVQQQPGSIGVQLPDEPPAVLAEEINEQNATEKARALAEEIHRDGRRRTEPEAVGENR